MNAKKILLISQHYQPEPNFITADVAASLARAGYSVTVITAHPNYPLGRFYDTVQSLWPQKTLEQGVWVWRLPFVPDHSHSKLRRFLAYGSFSFMASLFAPLAQFRPDAVWVYNAPFTTAAASLFFRYATGAKLALISPDLWPESFEASGVAPSKNILKIMYAYSRWIHTHAHLLVATTRGMKKRYLNDGIEEHHLRLVPLWVEGSKIAMKPEQTQAKEKADALPTIVYAGNLGPAQGLEALLEGALLLQNEKIGVQFDFYGTGSREAFLKARIAELNLKNVALKGRVSQAQALKLSQEATAQLVHLLPSPLFAMTVPSKLAFCLAMGRPLLLGAPGETAEIARESGGAIVFCPGDAQDFARALKQLLAMSEEQRNAMGAKARLYFETHLNPSVLAEQYVELTKALLDGEFNAP